MIRRARGVPRNPFLTDSEKRPRSALGRLAFSSFLSRLLRSGSHLVAALRKLARAGCTDPRHRGGPGPSCPNPGRVPSGHSSPSRRAFPALLVAAGGRRNGVIPARPEDGWRRFIRSPLLAFAALNRLQPRRGRQRKGHERLPSPVAPTERRRGRSSEGRPLGPLRSEPARV